MNPAATVEFRENRAKFTLDATYLPNGSPSDQTAIGILAADKNEFVVRAQFQLVL